MELKPFIQFDWDCYSGATRGPLGQQPAIGYVELSLRDFPDSIAQSAQGTVIVDGDGIVLTTEPDECGQYFLPCTFAAGLAIGKALVEPVERSQLDALGFKRIN
jgi:hypothetical protein